MAVQYSVAVRNAKLDTFETTAGTSAKLRIYSGAKPADCATAASGTLLVEMALPSDWMSAASGGVKAKTGTWSGTGAAGAGAGTNAGYFRIVDTAGTTTHMQGTVTAAGGGGDMTLDNISIAQNQTVTVNTFSITEGNA
jgi:hypothetical protein